MAIITTNCTKCGEEIEVNDAKTHGTCPHCGYEYDTEVLFAKILNPEITDETVDGETPPPRVLSERELKERKKDKIIRIIYIVLTIGGLIAVFASGILN